MPLRCGFTTGERKAMINHPNWNQPWKQEICMPGLWQIRLVLFPGSWPQGQHVFPSPAAHRPRDWALAKEFWAKVHLLPRSWEKLCTLILLISPFLGRDNQGPVQPWRPGVGDRCLSLLNTPEGQSHLSTYSLHFSLSQEREANIYILCSALLWRMFVVEVYYPRRTEVLTLTFGYTMP